MSKAPPLGAEVEPEAHHLSRPLVPFGRCRKELALPGETSSSQSPLCFVSARRRRKLRFASLLVLSPRRHKLHILRFRLWRKLIHFAAAPFPTKAQLMWGPQLSASLGFGGGPIFLPSYPAIFYAAYGRLHLVFKPGGLHL